MKNYIIVLLCTISLVLASFVYKYKKARICDNFPLTDTAKANENSAVNLNLYLVFNSRNCRDCLKIVDILNYLPPRFRVIGLVPKRDFLNQKDLKDLTGAKFELKCYDRYKKYLPHYAPTLFGVSNTGKILFVLPAVPNEYSYLGEFLESFFDRAYTLISEDVLSQDN